jgi:hypothetical protein
MTEHLVVALYFLRRCERPGLDAVGAFRVCGAGSRCARCSPDGPDGLAKLPPGQDGCEISFAECRVALVGSGLAAVFPASAPPSSPAFSQPPANVTAHQGRPDARWCLSCVPQSTAPHHQRTSASPYAMARYGIGRACDRRRNELTCRATLPTVVVGSGRYCEMPLRAPAVSSSSLARSATCPGQF